MLPLATAPNLRVAVVSIGRSGTSVISRILHEVLSIDFGDEADHIPRNHNNPDGYFENREMLELNERILAAVNGAVLRPPAMDAFVRLDPANRKNLTETASERLNYYAASKPSFGWKDPRLSLTFPIWKAAVPNVVAVIVFRDPRAVMRSIADQLDVAPTSLSGLWLDYYRRIFRDTADCNRVVVSFDQLLDEPLRVVETIATHFNIVIDKNTAERQLAGIVKPKQAKHRVDATVSKSELALDPNTESVYFYLRDAVAKGHQPDFGMLDQLLNPTSAGGIPPTFKRWWLSLIGR